jgi:predicted ATPase/DNA-binding CsgD family transcriptional regulator
MRGHSSPKPRGRLRGELSCFVGRRAELAGVRRALSASRLVTLTGPAGIGKTRLAAQAAAEARRGFSDGAWLVGLAGLRDPAFLAPEVARSLGLFDQTAQWAVATLAERLTDCQALLVLDNCEHMLDACAVLADALLRACPDLRILTTSREVLGVTGEVTLPVPPMSVPRENLPTGPADLLAYEAVRLFAERGAAVLPGFTVDAANHMAVAALCRRLEGIPLAIELAAVRLRAISPEQILARLEDRFALLSGGDRATPRHETLQAALRWSYDLLTPDERALWCRSSVFTGAFDLDAAEAVCTGDGIGADQIADLVDALVAKSVLVRRPGHGPARYTMLDTVREYGQHRLQEAAREPLLRRRHRDWYAALAGRQEGFGARQIEWFDCLEADHENLRAALEFCLAEPGESPAGLRLACDLWLYWETRGHLTEGRKFLGALAGQAGPAPAPAGRKTAGRPRQDHPERTRGMWVAGYLALVQADAIAARGLLEDALTSAEGEGDTQAVAYATQFLGRAVWFTGEPGRGLGLTERALRRHRAGGDWQGVAQTLVQLGIMRTFMGHPEAAVKLFEGSAAECQAHGERWNRSYALWGLGLATWLLGDTELGAELEREALRAKRDIGDQIGLPLVLDALAWIAASRNQAASAADLLGAAEAGWHAVPATLPEPLAPLRTAAITQARTALGEHSFTAHLARARAAPFARSLAAALGEPAHPSKTAPSPEPPRLTPREQEVATLITQGLSNQEIAATMVISARTAETHVRHIMVKFGFTSRAQVAAWATAEAAANPAASGELPA